MPTAPILDSRPATSGRRPPRMVIISAWLVPILVVGQFAMVAVLPVALVLVGTLRDARLRALRWWSAGLAVAYAIPLTVYVTRPDRAQSLSKDIHPGFVALIVVASVAVIVAFHVLRRHSRVDAPGGVT